MADINSDFAQRVVVHSAQIPWIASPIVGTSSNGPKRTCRGLTLMSAFGGGADTRPDRPNVADDPIRTRTLSELRWTRRLGWRIISGRP